MGQTEGMALINVPSGANLQSAINSAQLGDVLSLEAGATFIGPIELPNKLGSGELIIQSSRVAELPQGRVNPSHSGLMPKIIAPNNEQAIRTLPGAHHYSLIGIEVLPEANAPYIYDLVRFGGSRHNQQTLGSVPHHLKMDRCYVHGHPTSDFQSGLQLNSSDSEVTRSHFSEIHGKGKDSQAILSSNTPGRNKIVDCYLEAAGENVMFGGVDPFSVEFLPSDFQIIKCDMFKPLAWKTSNAPWTVKNLFEVKNGRRILVDGCRFENNWGGQRADGSDWGQDGTAIVFTVRNQEYTAPYSTVEDVKFQNCTVLNAPAALNFLGEDNESVAKGFPSGRGKRVDITNCVFDKIAGIFLTMNGFYDVHIRRVTHLQGGNTTKLYGQKSTGFIYEDNVTKEEPYGIYAEGGLIATPALAMFTPGAFFVRNTIATPYDNQKVAGNDYLASLTIGPDYRHSYTGKGADIDALNAAQSGVSSPTPPTPVPPIPIPPTPVPPTAPRVLLYPSSESSQTALWQKQAAENYRPNRHVAKPAGAPKGQYVEFVKFP